MTADQMELLAESYAELVSEAERLEREFQRLDAQSQKHRDHEPL
jgi:hypothetical protein